MQVQRQSSYNWLHNLHSRWHCKYYTNSVFEGNSASMNDAYADVFVGSLATVDGCGNEGLEDELGSECLSSSVAWIALVLSVFVGSISLVMAL